MSTNALALPTMPYSEPPKKEAPEGASEDLATGSALMLFGSPMRRSVRKQLFGRALL